MGTSRRSIGITPRPVGTLLPTPRANESSEWQWNGSGTKKTATLSGAIKQSISSPEASPASLFPLPGRNEERRMIATSGLRCLESSKSQIPDGSWQRMFLASLTSSEAWYSKECTLIWKVKATKFSRRLYFQLVGRVRRTEGIESGLWPDLLRTPCERDHHPSGGKYTSGQAVAPQIQLAHQIAMLPTPAQRDYKGGCETTPFNTLDTLIELGATSGQIGKKTGMKLQPAFVEWVMGFPKFWTELTD